MHISDIITHAAAFMLKIVLKQGPQWCPPYWLIFNGLPLIFWWPAAYSAAGSLIEVRLRGRRLISGNEVR